MTTPRARLASVLRHSGPLVRIADLEGALGVSRVEASKIASRWVQQGRFFRLRRGVYAPVPIDSEAETSTLENPWQLVPVLFGPGFVTGWSAAEHWDLTEQLFRRICVKTATDVRRKIVRVRDVEFYLTHVSKEGIFGTRAHWAGTIRVEVADPHRTVVDMLDDPSLGGGARHMAGCVAEYLRSGHMDPPTLIEYADRMANGAVFKRLGFIAEGIVGRESALVGECRVRLTTGYAKLDPAVACKRIVTRWRLRVPSTWSLAGGAEQNGTVPGTHPYRQHPNAGIVLRSKVMVELLAAVDLDKLAELCRRHGIQRLALFGSAARGELRPDSDVDLLVEFEPGRPVGLRFITVADELSDLLGRKIDLNTAGFLSPHFRNRVLREAVLLYEAA